MVERAPATHTTAGSDETRRQRLEKLRFWRRACADTSQTVTPYNASSGSNPLIFFHGDYDTGGIYVRRLAALSGQPLMAIAPQGVHGDRIAASIQEMAADRLGEIRAIRQHGPYRLGGYCNGALVAFEAARMLSSQGETVEIVILLEPSSLNTRPVYRLAHRIISMVFDPLGRHSALSHKRIGAAMWNVWSLGRIAKMSPAEITGLVRYLRERRTTRRRRLHEHSDTGEAERQLQEKFIALTNAHYRASAAHIPQFVDFPVVGLSTGRDGGGRSSDLYDAASWQAVCSNFRHIRLPGHHSTCLSEGVEVLAGYLETLLSKTGKRAFPDKQRNVRGERDPEYIQ